MVSVPRGVRPVVLVLAVLLNISGVFSQTGTTTRRPSTTTAAAGTTGPPPIVIQGCPPVVPTTYTRNAEEQTATVVWEEPYATSSSVFRSTDFPSGSTFGLGINEVIYIFSDGRGNTALCSFNVTVVLGPPPIIIEGCPPVVPTAYTPTPQTPVRVYWNEPNATISSILRSTDFPSGSLFAPGIHEVVYIFSDGVGGSSTCRFNVTVVLQCSTTTEIPCTNGFCVDQSAFCDGYNDCGDGFPFGSDEAFGECFGIDACNAANPTLYSACSTSTNFVTATGAGFQDTNSGPRLTYTFQVPGSATENTYLSRVMVNVTGVTNLTQLPLQAPVLFITINVPASALRANILSHLLSRRGDTPLIVTEDLRQPLPVAPNEEIQITLEFDENILDTSPPIPAENPCPNCVSLQYQTMTSGCDNTTCFDSYITWKNLIVSSSMSGRACGVIEQNNIIDSLYSACLSPPDFAYVSESQASFIEDTVILKCIAEGQVPPLVEWYNDRMEVVASGVGYAAFNVFVFEPMSFTCMLDKKIRYDEVVTVSPWSAECDQRYRSVFNFQFQGSCQVSLPQPTATNVNTFSNVYSFRPTSPIVVYQFQLAASALVMFGRFPGNIDSPDETFTALLPLRLSITYPLRRKRRAADLTSIYERDYTNVFVSSTRLVTLEIDPPVKLNANMDIDVQVTVLQPGPPNEFERPPPLYVLDAVECLDRNGTSCTDFIQDWYQAQQAFEAAKCTSEKNLVLQAFQICENTSAAEPKIIRHPRSVDITMTGGRRNAFMTCDIENVVSYSWYKVAPSPQQMLVKTGSTLSFPQVDLNDIGSYVCIGTGGNPFSDVRLETRPATLTVEGISVFKVTLTLVNIAFTSNLTNPGSSEFRNLRSIVEQEIRLPFLIALNASDIQLEVTDFRAGSVIADLVMVVAGVLVPDDVTAKIVAAEVSRIPSETLLVLPDSVKVVSLVTCYREQVGGRSGNATFPQTRIGQTAQSVEQCPQFSAKAGMVLGTRKCAGDLLSEAYWLPPELTDCYGDGNVNLLLEDLSHVKVTQENAKVISQETVNLTSEYEQINTTGIIAVADILENLLNAGEPSIEVGLDVIRVVNNILQVDQETYDDLGNDTSTSRVILSLEAYVTKLQTNDDARNLTQVLSNIAVTMLQLPRESLELGLGFAAVPTTSGPVDSLLNDDVMVYYDPEGIPVPRAKASISLPPAILDFVKEGDEVQISFFFYLSSKLFRSPTLQALSRPQDNFQRVVGSYVISATVEGVRIENLPMDAPVVGTFQPLKVSSSSETVNGTECVFWDFMLNNGFGDWSNKGCRVVEFVEGNPVCHCDHLTSFAVIVDIYGNQASVALSIISKIGCAVSIVALVITIVTYLAIKKLRTKRPQQILISFSFALLGLYLIFLVGIEATASHVGCIIVAALIHYFTLASVSWMAVEAANMYLLFVKILNANVSRFLLKASILAWGLPLVVVIVILSVDHTNYNNENHCFLNVGNAFYYGQILPIGLVLTVNFIIFALVMRQLTCARKGISSTTDKSKRQEITRRLQNAFSISVLLGLTWTFGLLSLIEKANFAFQVLFCIFNSLQGLMIFILFCVRQEEIRKAWLDFVTCKWKKDRMADYKAKGGQSRDKDFQPHGAIPLTSDSAGTQSTGTRNSSSMQ